MQPNPVQPPTPQQPAALPLMAPPRPPGHAALSAALVRSRVDVGASSSGSPHVGHRQRAGAAVAAGAGAAAAADERMTVCVSLLRHLAYGSATAKQVLVRDGVVEVARKLWRHCAAGGSGAAGAMTPSPAPSLPLLHELLGLLTNLLPCCAEARARFGSEGGSSGSGGPTLLQSAVEMLFAVGGCLTAWAHKFAVAGLPCRLVGVCGQPGST